MVHFLIFNLFSLVFSPIKEVVLFLSEELVSDLPLFFFSIFLSVSVLYFVGLMMSPSFFLPFRFHFVSSSKNCVLGVNRGDFMLKCDILV